MRFDRTYIQSEYTKYIGRGNGCMVSLIRNLTGFLPTVESAQIGYNHFLDRYKNKDVETIFRDVVAATGVKPDDEVIGKLEIITERSSNIVQLSLKQSKIHLIL